MKTSSTKQNDCGVEVVAQVGDERRDLVAVESERRLYRQVVFLTIHTWLVGESRCN
jgi:hypothetical protein